jgi:D-serine dehydratase
MTIGAMQPASDLLLDPWLGPGSKGFPVTQAPMRVSLVAAQGWNVLAGDVPLPLAVIRQSALAGNIGWLQRLCDARGVHLAPHGKTTMSPQLFRRQLDAGAWGITVANVAQLAVAVAAGARRCVIANQLLQPHDLRGVVALQASTPGLEVLSLLDSPAQLALIEAERLPAPIDVLIEMGVPGGRTGVRDVDAAVRLAALARAGGAVRVRGVECYEGLRVTGDDDVDRAGLASLMARVAEVVRRIDAAGGFDGEAIVVSAGGSGLIDLVADVLAPGAWTGTSKPVAGVMRSGCYVTHDDGQYRRLAAAIVRRMGCATGLEAAIEVWTVVQSHPEPGLAYLNAGRRDVSFDIDLPIPRRWCPAGAAEPVAAPASWQVVRLNDQHAHLSLGDGGPVPAVGDRVALGISHPCTTFDKWSWMAVVDDNYRIVDAIATCF